MEADRSRLTSGLTRAAWGYLFLHININIGNVSVLPNFVGSLLLLSAISALESECRDLRLLRPLGILLAVWNSASWLASWFGISLNGLFVPLDMVIAVADLYFHFQFLTDMAVIARRFQPEDDDLDRRLLARRTVYTVTSTAITVLLRLSFASPDGPWMWLTFLCLFAGVVAAITVITGLFALRKCAAEAVSN